MHSANTLFIMVKYPSAGRVKTRLGRSIGHGRAVNIYRTFISRIFRKLACDPRWQTVLAITPRDRIFHPCWPLNIWRVPQVEGDLGNRMGHIMTRAAAGRVVIIGADCPQICSRDIALAFQKLARNDVVFGPSVDGGYWLVGQKGLNRRNIFRNVRWSGEHTLADTLKNCHSLKVGNVRVLRDIDELDDYQTWLRLNAI